MTTVCSECGKSLPVQSNQIFMFCPHCRAPLVIRDNSKTELMTSQQARKLAQEHNDAEKLRFKNKLALVVTEFAEDALLKVFTVARGGSHQVTLTLSLDNLKLSYEEFIEHEEWIQQQLTDYFEKLDYEIEFRGSARFEEDIPESGTTSVIIKWQ